MQIVLDCYSRSWKSTNHTVGGPDAKDWVAIWITTTINSLIRESTYYSMFKKGLKGGGHSKVA